MKDRIYVCHTFYHVYISVVKELNLDADMRGKATLVLSTMSNDFGELSERVRATGLFEEVYMFDEKVDSFFPELQKYHADRGNVVLNLLQRIKYTKLLGKLQEPYVPVNFKEYRDIYVFCDSDPIGYYLSYKHIYYHAVEDGLDCIKYLDGARYGNRGHFGLKAWMAAHNLIFIEFGYAKYCIDMEVNDISVLKYKMDKYVEVPRAELIENVPMEDRHFYTEIFLEDGDELINQLSAIDANAKKIMILSDPVCDLDTRVRIMKDIIDRYCIDGVPVIKPHPRDVVDYSKEFPECLVIRGRFPMEIMNYMPELHMDKIVSIFTPLEEILFADEKVFLGPDFMDEYEEPALHRQNEVI